MNINLIEKQKFEKNRKYPNQYYYLKVLTFNDCYYPIKIYHSKTAAYNAMINHYQRKAIKYPSLHSEFVRKHGSVIYCIDKYSSEFGGILYREIYSIEGEI